MRANTLLCATRLGHGDPLVRNLATIGGNLAHADPANDHPATLLALGAEIVATGLSGERTMHQSPSSLPISSPPRWRPDEILTEVRISPVHGSGGAYLKLERKVGDFAIGCGGTGDH